MSQKKALIISSSLVQDQEFVYPFYRLLEENIKVDVYLLENTITKGFLGSTIPPNKDHPIHSFDELHDNFETINAEIPLGPDSPVRAITIYKSEKPPPDVKALVPFNLNPSLVILAFVFNADASDPVSGSVKQ